MESQPGPSSTFPGSDDDDSVLANSEYLTQQEVRKRRANHRMRYARFLRAHYWLLLEDLRRKHREFVWKYGKSPFQEEHDGENGVLSGDCVNNNNNNDNNNDDTDVNNGAKSGFGGSFSWCGFPLCRSKAMALSNYCLQHILSDSKQVLYTSCQYALKSTPDGPILCGKPVLKSTIPSMCNQHLKMAEGNMRRALKKGGASLASSNKLASKFHLVLVEYIRYIQTRRRAAANRRKDDIAMEDSST